MSYRSLLGLCLLLLISGYVHSSIGTPSIAADGIGNLYRESPMAGHPALLAKRWDELSEQDKRRINEARDRYERMPRDKKQNLREKWERMPAREKEKYRIERKKR